MAKRVRLDLAGVALAGVLLAAPAMSGAAVLYENPLGPIADLDGGDPAFLVTDTLLAENFILGASSLVQSIIFNGYHRAGPSPEAPRPDSIDWSIRSNDGSLPGASILGSGTSTTFVTSFVVADPNNADFHHLDYLIDVSLSNILLDAGEYWVTFHVNNSLEDDPAWTLARNMGDPLAYDSIAAVSNDGGATWGSAGDLVFRIEGTAAVPVPATLSLLGLGLALLGARRRALPG